MASKYGLQIDGRKVAAAIRRVPGALARNLETAFDRDGHEFRNAMRRSFRGWDGQARNTTDQLRRRSGFLSESMGHEVIGKGTGDLTKLSLAVFSAGNPAARAQEKGAEIAPKPPRKYLTIPIDDNIQPSGVVRNPSAQALRGDHSTFVLRTKSGGLYIVRRVGGSGNPHGDLEFLFKLVRRVKIPPRLGFLKTWKGLADSRRARRLAAINKAMREAVRG